MKDRLSYQDFQRRQKLAESDYLIAERAWQRDLRYIRSKGVKTTILDEIKGQIAPPGSLLARFVNPPKRERRRRRSPSSSFDKTSRPSKRPTYKSLTQGSGDTEMSLEDRCSNRTQRVISSGIALAKPILWSVGVGMIRGYLRKRFKFLRFILR